MGFLPASSAASSVAVFNSGTRTSGGAPVLVPAFASGTAAQLADTTRDYMVYLTCTSAGTGLSVAVGPTSGVVNTLLTGLAVAAGDMLSVRLPAGWYLQWAATAAAFSAQLAIGC
jgi:hypothetical protein